MKGGAREEAILAVLTGMYAAGQLRCAEGPLHVARIPDTDEVRLRTPKYSLRFPEAPLVELIHQSRVPVSEELVRVLLCLIYRHHDQNPWAKKERTERVV